MYSEDRLADMEEQPLTPQQCRAARAILDLPQRELARRARVDIETLMSFETAGDASTDDDVEALQGASEEAGVVMIAKGSNSPAGGEECALGNLLRNRSIRTRTKSFNIRNSWEMMLRLALAALPPLANVVQ